VRQRLPLAFIAVGLALLAVAIPVYRRASAGPSVRTVDITIHFSRFSVSNVDVTPGETVRFVVENTDPIDHEFIVGDRQVQLIHERGTEPLHPPKPGEMSVPAGTTQTTTYTFPSTQGPTLFFACHLPGHYAYGMHGTITIA
jgi:uncharacterized cupredoxin-like copper-binding protein